MARFLADGDAGSDGSYRALNADGSIPGDVMLNASYRGTDVRALLARDSVDLDRAGRASQEQRLTADALIKLIGRWPRREPLQKRAWMVRGSSVDGRDLAVFIAVRSVQAEGWERAVTTA